MKRSRRRRLSNYRCLTQNWECHVIGGSLDLWCHKTTQACRRKGGWGEEGKKPSSLDNKGSQAGIIHCLVDNGETNLRNNELLFSELTDLFHLKSNLWDLMFFTVKAAKMFIFSFATLFCFKVNNSQGTIEKHRWIQTGRKPSKQGSELAQISKKPSKEGSKLAQTRTEPSKGL